MLPEQQKSSVPRDGALVNSPFGSCTFGADICKDSGLSGLQASDFRLQATLPQMFHFLAYL